MSEAKRIRLVSAAIVVYLVVGALGAVLATGWWWFAVCGWICGGQFGVLMLASAGDEQS